MSQKNTILIVDDIQSNLILLDKILSDEGYQVISAANGDEAIAATQNYSFDLILLDIMMPKKDGFLVFDELKSNATTENIPVIFITVINNDADILKAFEMGAVDYITKPFTPTELRIRIKTQIALVNAHKSGTHQAEFLTEAKTTETPSLFQELHNKLKIIKQQIQELDHKELYPQEKEKLEDLKNDAGDILQLLQSFN